MPGCTPRCPFAVFRRPRLSPIECTVPGPARAAWTSLAWMLAQSFAHRLSRGFDSTCTEGLTAL